VTLVHGDFRNGNLIVGPDGVRAVLDWELAHFGDPMEDLGWLCVNSWRFGIIDKPVGGFGQLSELIAGYESAGGGTVDPRRVILWQALGTLRWGVICLGMLARYESGKDRSIERAMIARRASEAEIDLLRIIAPRG
jgi:aminoglycoside phosphotransferase (APT) family kinase protein